MDAQTLMTLVTRLTDTERKVDGLMKLVEQMLNDAASQRQQAEVDRQQAERKEMADLRAKLAQFEQSGQGA